MVNAQEWLDANYPKENRSKITKIYLNEPSLEGELDLGDFTCEYGVKVYISSEVDETKLTFINKSKYVCIVLLNAQKWLESQEEYNTKEKRNQITKLDISGKDLEGHLNLSEFINLEWLDCSCNYLTGLEIPLSNCEKITVLDLRDNNVYTQDLSIFSQFINLRKLGVGNRRYERENMYNRFTGSLIYLQNLSKLIRLNISNTDIEEGLEYLPESLERIHYDRDIKSKDWAVKSIIKQLSDYMYDWDEKYYNYLSWRKDYNKWKKHWEDKDSGEEGGKWIEMGFLSSFGPKESLRRILEWKNNGFDCQQTKNWIKIGFEKNQAHLAFSWRKLGLEYNEAKKWMEIGIDPSDFWKTKKLKDEGFDVQQTKEWIKVGFEPRLIVNACDWRRLGFNLSEAKEWMETGFQPSEFKKVMKLKSEGFDILKTKKWMEIGFNTYQVDEICSWNKLGFEYSEVKKWLEAGFSKWESDFAKYLKTKDYTPSVGNLSLSLDPKRVKNKLESEYWLNKNYPKEKRGEFNNLNIDSNYLRGSLIIENWIGLQKASLTADDGRYSFHENKNNKLKLSNLPSLAKINFSGTWLNNLYINNCPSITYLGLNAEFFNSLSFLNNLNWEKIVGLQISNADNLPAQDLTIFNKFKNLENLTLEGKSFVGTLESLKNLIKLRNLSIENTNIDDGLEHLPDSLEKIIVSKDQNSKEIYLDRWGSFYKKTFGMKGVRKVTHAKEIEKQLENYDGDIRLWKKDNQALIAITKKKPKDLLKEKQDLQKQIEELKEQVEEYSNYQKIHKESLTNIEAKYEGLKEILSSLLENEEMKKNKKERKVIELDREMKEAEKRGHFYGNKVLVKVEPSGGAKRIIRSVEKLKNEKEKLNDDVINLHEINQKLSQQLALYQELKKNIENKEREIENLKLSCIQKTNYLKRGKIKQKIETLLEAQEEIVKLDSNFAKKQKEENQKYLTKKTAISSQEIINICLLQEEITKFKLELQKIVDEQEKQLKKKISKGEIKVNQVTVEQGNVFIGNQIGNNPNLGYTNQSQVREEFQTQIQIPPKKN